MAAQNSANTNPPPYASMAAFVPGTQVNGVLFEVTDGHQVLLRITPTAIHIAPHMQLVQESKPMQPTEMIRPDLSR